ncbi:MAG TPA: S-layer homology domain-containing protein [Candidatus Acutalibacter pullistercoris]|uniref:S-layer homology domain-containing protein n=1 Tax=Candidatus Acutalibacter pullistercoris TaxID=2838418 RepID=A0A9D1YAN4_9FIRM|nr:S-layer homology domain-containing protein [Candidatus Acutalibacter pullistercoris]
MPNSQANLLLVTGSYSDSISLELPLPDYQALLEGASSIPVQVGVTNQGTQPITQLTFTVGEQARTYSDLNLQPGESTDLTLDYTVQKNEGTITCPEYSVTATFSDNITVTEKGDVEINLNVHDLGISTFQETEQANGQRVLQFSLFNNSPAKLENSGKNVVVGVFSDSSCTVPISSAYLDFGSLSNIETREFALTDGNNETETITTKVLSLSDEDLALIDNGAYQGQLTFNLKGYAHDNKDDFLEKGEIRDAGISLYLKVWVEETDEKNQLQELGEVITGNNTQGLTLNSLMKDSDEQVTISGDVTTDDAGNTVVTPTLQNNSLNATARGYLIVDLLDENGNLLESKQTYTMIGETPSSLITLGEEAVVTLDPLTFTQKGSSVKYRFGQHQDASSTKLTGISLTGIPLAFDENTNTYSVTVDKDLSQTILTLTQAYLGAQIKVNGQPYNGSAQISLPAGTTTLTIEVTSGAETQTYTVHITRPSGGSSGSQGGTGGAARYPVSLSGEVEHGSVTISPTRATAGQTVTLTPKAEEGYELRKLQVIGPDGGEIALTKKADGTYTFKMPKGSVKVTAVFGCDGTGDCPSKNFTDLGESQWYHDYIDYAVEHGLLEGTSHTTMEPNATLTRAQLAQILYNLEGKPAVTGDLPFEDVPEGQWYYAAILWANQEGVVNGMSPDTFEPGTNISRQDPALMLYRYAGEPETQGSLEKFQDAGKVGDWAKEAITWAVEEGIIDGMTPTTLEPTGTATRAQAAAMLQRFLEG